MCGTEGRARFASLSKSDLQKIMGLSIQAY